MQRNVAAGRVPADAVTVAGFTGRAQSLRDIQVGSLREMVVVLQAIVIVVLLIACANLANLQLTRVTSRRKELAVRSALGAGGERLVRMVLVEALLLALAGGALGVAVAVGGLALVRALGLDQSNEGFAFVLDTTALTYTLGSAVLAAVVSGLPPVLALLRDDLTGVIREAGRQSGGGRRAQRLRSGFVVAQLAMSVVLLVGAGCSRRASMGCIGEGPGFSAGSVWTAQFYAGRAPLRAARVVAALPERGARRVAGAARCQRGRLHVGPAVRQRQRFRVDGDRRLRDAGGRGAAARSAPLDRRSAISPCSGSPSSRAATSPRTSPSAS